LATSAPEKPNLSIYSHFFQE